jgi:hypothetical protein
MILSFENVIVACSISAVLAVVDILAAFPVPRGFVSTLVKEFWCWVYAAFYALITLCLAVVLDEQRIIAANPWTWTFGLGAGVPLALQMKLKFDTPWVKENSGFSVGLQQVADRVRVFCYHHITSALNDRHQLLKKAYLEKNSTDLENMLRDYLSPEDHENARPMLEEAKIKSQDDYKALMVTLLFEKNPYLLRESSGPVK